MGRGTEGDGDGEWSTNGLVSTPISTTSDQASRQRDAPTLNPAKTARASLESAILYCSARRGRGGRRRGRQEALIAQ